MGDRRHTREDSGLVLDREGRWFHDGEPVEHPKIAQAFSRGIERAPDGRYQVRFGKDWCFVRVEGTPLQVLSARADGEALEVSYSNGHSERLPPEALFSFEGVLHCQSRSGMPARFSRAAQLAVGQLVEEGEGGLRLKLGARSWPLFEREPERARPPSEGPPTSRP